MSNTTGSDRATPEAETAASGRLRSIVVTYEGAADRRTLYPPDATEVERLTHWLTADADAFHHLDEMR
ncbi:DUF7511 domain-containing protein [Haloplanus ruber]|uniref:DUF7511 domain-containing protein n=1 Tax=Haloplanus ruber TaxID=869892 RepID=A0ABD6D2H3_9EURY|nr:hypothetical protein [Haloplanus ruber]